MNKLKFFILIVILLGMGFCVVFYSQKYMEAQNYNYTLTDVYYNHYTSNEVFDVSVSHIRKEKGKEDVYEVDCQVIPEKGNEFASNEYSISPSLTKLEFEKIIGNDNNSVSSKIYVLELAVSSTFFDLPFTYSPSTYYITIYRYSCFGESDFTKEEIKDFAILALDVFSEANVAKKYERLDLSLMKEKVKCTKLGLSSGGGKDGLKEFDKIVQDEEGN